MSPSAGGGTPLVLGKITAEQIDETFNTNVKGTIFTVQQALPLTGKGGSIILTGSSAGTTGVPGYTAGSASKAAVRNLARIWAEDLKGTGIRGNVLSPGATAAELTKEALGEEGQKAYGAMTPLQRMADPAEIGAVAAFLASDDSSFMTASEVAVDGGLALIACSNNLCPQGLPDPCYQLVTEPSSRRRRGGRYTRTAPGSASFH